MALRHKDCSLGSLKSWINKQLRFIVIIIIINNDDKLILLQMLVTLNSGLIITNICIVRLNTRIPKFRSYKPQDETLKENVLEEPKPGDVEAEVQDLLSAAKQKVVIEELDIASLAPRKPDWDLKRDVAKKSEKLERRTQKAIAELIIERLKHGESQDLATAVIMAGNTNSEMKS
ncbi:hypothetical protein PV327_001840 [Microctonus hyperodae]|uniref:Coiled-coil domain-containing protein 12 n=1 Tax=Microctonus hyperodae TaxID=165561 RepID=A0AA39KNM5_MICHY|nr:hypothetical protein PV327_001840 [Microctonus hyperodae]